jgi:ElaB/YqjD/DUF883 family membrane-anchored ribosome-binding protein
MADNKNDPQTTTPGSLSQKPDDAKISAGSSLGSAGTPPKPPGMAGAQSSSGASGSSLGGSPAMGSTPSTATGTGMGSAGAGASGGAGAQSSTLSSHTSKPLGGGAGPTGAGVRQGSEFARHQDQSAQGGRQGANDTSDQAREAADQIRERAADMYESASDWARDKYEAASHWAGSSSGSRSRQGSFQRFANENPMLVGVVGLAAGLLLGALLPRTRQEDRTFGEWSDEVRNQGLRYASEAVHRGREYAEQAFTGDDPAFAQHDSDFRRPASAEDEAAKAARVTSPVAGQYRNH